MKCVSVYYVPHLVISLCCIYPLAEIILLHFPADADTACQNNTQQLFILF